jgi:hypothetical protein
MPLSLCLAKSLAITIAVLIDTAKGHVRQHIMPKGTEKKSFGAPISAASTFAVSLDKFMSDGRGAKKNIPLECE